MKQSISRNMFLVVAVTINERNEITSKEKKFFFKHSEASAFARERQFYHPNRQVTTHVYRV